MVILDIQYGIALVKLDPKTSLLPTAKLGNSSALCQEDWIVSFSSQEYVFLMVIIGYYGGPLMNLDGEVVGVISMHYKDAHGIGLVVPSDSVFKTIEKWSYGWCFMGIMIKISMLRDGVSWVRR
ncbi:unnamed protein product [Arabis nemorensis]|uniref:Peptidase S1 domain-containing protein n=1 Tax=Arabis nemorensis TaxID=586526 RepID=A0A565CVF5_9BRAS|nr:unnamed protein product [Arabis nemorensis]